MYSLGTKEFGSLSHGEESGKKKKEKKSLLPLSACPPAAKALRQEFLLALCYRHPSWGCREAC